MELADEGERVPSAVFGDPGCEREDRDEGEDEAHAWVEEPDWVDEDSSGGAVARAAGVGGDEGDDRTLGERVRDRGYCVLWGVRGQHGVVDADGSVHVRERERGHDAADDADDSEEGADEACEAVEDGSSTGRAAVLIAGLGHARVPFWGLTAQTLWDSE